MKQKGYGEDIVMAFLMNTRTTDIAKAANISRTTVLKYKKDPELQAILTERRTEMLQQATDKLRATLLPACETMVEVLNDPEASSQTRLNAAVAIFQQCKALIETSDLERRIHEIEAGKVQILTILNDIPRGR